MSDRQETVAGRKGFDRSSSGVELAPAEVEIDRSQVRFLAKVLGLRDPIHFDVDAAHGEGFRDLVAPPSFFMVVEAAAEEARRSRGCPTLFEVIAADFKYLLHGDERYTYLAPLCAGDTVIYATVVGEISDKKGGLIEAITVRSEISHASLGPLVRAERTLLHRFG